MSATIDFSEMLKENFYIKILLFKGAVFQNKVYYLKNQIKNYLLGTLKLLINV